MTDPTALELLVKAAGKFRFYEQQHRAKLELKGIDELLAEETVAKADVNAAMANEIEEYINPILGNLLDDVRLPDTLFQDHRDMVTTLQKSGEAILAQMTPLKIMCLHMAGGAASEGGELFDAIKRWALFGKELDLVNVREELGDLEFFMEGLRQNLDIDRDQTLHENMLKLMTGSAPRYAGGVFSDAATIARADKEPVHRVEGLHPVAPAADDAGWTDNGGFDGSYGAVGGNN